MTRTGDLASRTRAIKPPFSMILCPILMEFAKSIQIDFTSVTNNLVIAGLYAGRVTSEPP